MKPRDRQQRRFKEGKSSKEGNKAPLLPGRKALMELFRARPKAVKQVYLLQTLKAQDDFQSVISAIAKSGVPITRISREELDQLLPDSQHQGVVSEIEPLTPISLSELLERSKKGMRVILALDEIQDPQNLGAILRVADAAGVDGIVMSEHRNAPLSAAVRKVSAGASELVPIAVISNLAEGLRQLKSAGYWIVGSVLSESSLNVFQADIDPPYVLVIGSEGTGLRPLTQSLCDYQVSLPMRGKLQSLNASHAAGILLYELWRKQEMQ